MDSLADPIYPTSPPAFLPAPAPLPEAPAARERGRLLRRATTVLLALQVPFAGAALVVADADEDGPPDLALAADRTDEITRFRLAAIMTLEAGGQGFDDVTMFEVEQDEDGSRMVMDAAALEETSGLDLGSSDDVALEMIAVGGQVFLRAPMYAELRDSLPPVLRPLADLGDRWGTYDLDEVGADLADVAAATGLQGTGMEEALDLVRASDEAIEELGPDEVRGVDVEVFETSITFDDLLELQGFRDGFVGGVIGSGGDSGDADDVLDALSDLPVELEVAVDGDGLVRRTAFRLDEGYLEAIADAMGQPTPRIDFEMEIAVEAYDFDDESIDVEAPDVEDPVDLTDWANDMLDAIGG